MTPSQHQFVVDGEGNRVAVLMGIEDYRKMMGMARQLEVIRGFTDSDGDEPTTATFAADVNAPVDDDLEALGIRSFP